MLILVVTLLVLSIFLMIWAIVDIIKHQENKWLIWFMILFPAVGPIYYFQIYRRKGKYKHRRSSLRSTPVARS
jgi:hypothetical protein